MIIYIYDYIYMIIYMCVFALQNRYYASSAASAKYNIYISPYTDHHDNIITGRGISPMRIGIF